MFLPYWIQRGSPSPTQKYRKRLEIRASEVMRWPWKPLFYVFSCPAAARKCGRVSALRCSGFGIIKRWGKIKRFTLFQGVPLGLFHQRLSSAHFRSKTHRQQILQLMKDWKAAHQPLRSHRCQSCPHTSYGPLRLFQGSFSSWWD